MNKIQMWYPDTMRENLLRNISDFIKADGNQCTVFIKFGCSTYNEYYLNDNLSTEGNSQGQGEWEEYNVKQRVEKAWERDKGRMMPKMKMG